MSRTFDCPIVTILRATFLDLLLARYERCLKWGYFDTANQIDCEAYVLFSWNTWFYLSFTYRYVLPYSCMFWNGLLCIWSSCPLLEPCISLQTAAPARGLKAIPSVRQQLHFKLLHITRHSTSPLGPNLNHSNTCSNLYTHFKKYKKHNYYENLADVTTCYGNWKVNHTVYRKAK